MNGIFPTKISLIKPPPNDAKKATHTIPNRSNLFFAAMINPDNANAMIPITSRVIKSCSCNYQSLLDDEPRIRRRLMNRLRISR